MEPCAAGSAKRLENSVSPKSLRAKRNRDLFQVPQIYYNRVPRYGRTFESDTTSCKNPPRNSSYIKVSGYGRTAYSYYMYCSTQ